MAYHLHRLNLTGEPLREALKGKAYLATALSQGRATIDHEFIDELSTALNIAADELSRSPTPEEDREWSFYRSSATNRKAVWDSTASIISTHKLSLRTVSEITGIDLGDLANAISGKQHVPAGIFLPAFGIQACARESQVSISAPAQSIPQ